MKFTEKLKSLRNSVGLTQEAAAEQIGVSVTSLQNWESGVNKPSMSNVRKIAEVYETGCDELAVSMLEDEGEKTVESNFPDFLFPDTFMDKIAEKHFTKELQESRGINGCTVNIVLGHMCSSKRLNREYCFILALNIRKYLTIDRDCYLLVIKGCYRCNYRSQNNRY